MKEDKNKFEEFIKNRKKEDEKIINYIIEEKWKEIKDLEMRELLLTLASRNIKDANFCSRIGSMLILNQFIEQKIKDCIDKSIQYIKAEVWPTLLNLEEDYKKTMLGDFIRLFEKYGVETQIKKEIIIKLKELNKERIKKVHKLFGEGKIVIKDSNFIENNWVLLQRFFIKNFNFSRVGFRVEKGCKRF